MRPTDLLSLLRGDPATPACPETLGETRYRESQAPTQRGPAPRPAPKLPTPQACRGPPGHFRNREEWFSGCDQQPRRGEQSTQGIPSEAGCDSLSAAPAALQGIRCSSWKQGRKLPEGRARHGQRGTSADKEAPAPRDPAKDARIRAGAVTERDACPQRFGLPFHGAGSSPGGGRPDGTRFPSTRCIGAGPCDSTPQAIPQSGSLRSG